MKAEARVHELKTWPGYYAEILNGRKTFEVRFNDRRFQVGDQLLLREWHPQSGYTGHAMRREITYFLDGFPGIERGHCVLGLSRAPASDTEGES